MDSLTFGATRFLRHLMDPSSRKIPVMEFEVTKILEELNLTMDQFIDLCILSGCDYCDSIKGIGGQTALKLIRQHGSIESILKNINRERYQIPEEWPYEEARRLFKEPLVFAENEEPELKWSTPDEEAIEKIKAAKNKTQQGRKQQIILNKKQLPKRRKAVAERSSGFIIHVAGLMEMPELEMAIIKKRDCCLQFCGGVYELSVALLMLLVRPV